MMKGRIFLIQLVSYALSIYSLQKFIYFNIHVHSKCGSFLITWQQGINSHSKSPNPLLSTLNSCVFSAAWERHWSKGTTVDSADRNQITSEIKKNLKSLYSLFPLPQKDQLLAVQHKCFQCSSEPEPALREQKQTVYTSQQVHIHFLSVLWTNFHMRPGLEVWQFENTKQEKKG